MDGLRDQSHRNDRDAVLDVLERMMRGSMVLRNDENMGLYKSISHHVTRFVERHGRVIILEDDLVVAEGFISYMLASLDYYQNDERVMQVSGYMFDVPKLRFETENILMPLTTTWGWGTWVDAWSKFSKATSFDYGNFLSNNRELRAFNLNGAYDFEYFLRERLRGANESWGFVVRDRLY